MDQLYRLKKKYGPSVEDMLAYLESCRAELEQIEYAGDTLARLEQALTGLKISGLKTNRQFLLRVLAQPAYLDARVHTRFIDQHSESLFAVAQPV